MTPSPQVTEQEEALVHSDHPPSTENDGTGILIKKFFTEGTVNGSYVA